MNQWAARVVVVAEPEVRKPQAMAVMAATMGPAAVVGEDR
jgi:hypothetical protein